MPVSNQSIREIIATHPSAANIFQRFDIDLCSQGEKSLDVACAELQLSIDQVLEKLEEADRRESGGRAIDPESLSIERLLQHIVRIHHQSARQILPGLTDMARQVAATQGKQRPALQEVAMLVESLRDEMLAHIEKEEQILFPYIFQLAQSMPVLHSSTGACFSSVMQPVRIMEREHRAVTQFLTELRLLTNGFEIPSFACATHMALLDGLRAFEADLKQHVHLEDDILFPRAIELEAKLVQRS